jgi:DNA-binding response OmpR family regulator
MSEQVPYILVVEDDVEIAETLCETLTEEGYAVSAVGDGGAAFDWIDKNGPPSLVLLDLTLPRVSGEQFLVRRKTIETLAAVPVIVFTAGPMEAKQAVELGAIAYFRKPLDYDTFIAMVKRYFAPDAMPVVGTTTLDWRG